MILVEVKARDYNSILLATRSPVLARLHIFLKVDGVIRL